MVSKEACADLKTGSKGYVIHRGDLRAFLPAWQVAFHCSAFFCLHGR